MKNQLRTILVLMAVIFVISPLVEGGMKRCQKCLENIKEGSYIIVEDLYFHAGHFLCNTCYRPIGKEIYRKNNGNFYHERCYREEISLSCDYCHQQIKGNYLTSGDRSYHNSCYKDNILESCQYCGDKLGDKYTIFETKQYHPACFNNHIALKCSLCNLAIKGEYNYDFWGNVFHLQHAETETACEFCSRYISAGLSGGGVIFGDGNGICALCLKTAVADNDDAEEIMGELSSVLRGLGIFVDCDNIPIKLISHPELRKISKNSHSDPLGITLHRQRISRNLFSTTTVNENRIYLLEKMPRTLFASILIHELMHVWIYQNGKIDSDQDIVEGSCNYISYEYLSGLNSPESEYYIEQLLTDQDPVYGHGFRKIKKMVEQNSLIYLLEYLRFNASLP